MANSVLKDRPPALMRERSRRFYRDAAGYYIGKGIDRKLKRRRRRRHKRTLHM
jgi:hypothetical protein